MMNLGLPTGLVLFSLQIPNTTISLGMIPQQGLKKKIKSSQNNKNIRIRNRGLKTIARGRLIEKKEKLKERSRPRRERSNKRNIGLRKLRRSHHRKKKTVKLSKRRKTALTNLRLARVKPLWSIDRKKRRRKKKRMFQKNLKKRMLKLQRKSLMIKSMMVRETTMKSIMMRKPKVNKKSKLRPTRMSKIQRMLSLTYSKKLQSLKRRLMKLSKLSLKILW
jgi:hypothetical protein